MNVVVNFKRQEKKQEVNLLLKKKKKMLDVTEVHVRPRISAFIASEPDGIYFPA